MATEIRLVKDDKNTLQWWIHGEGAEAWNSSFLLENLSFSCVKLTKMANNVLAPPFSEEPKLAPLLFKVSGSALALLNVHK